MTSLTKLFEPTSIKGVPVRNRLVFPPMATYFARDGHVSDEQVAYYTEKAHGGAGLVIVEAALVLEQGAEPMHLAIYHDRFIPRLRELARAIKAQGAMAGIQLCHFGEATPDPVGPSTSPFPYLDTKTRELSRQDIARLVEAFAEGARRAREAGFDLAEFHGARGYLISAFLSPLSNRRTDEYGGSVEGRTRFAREIAIAARERVGAGFALGFRMNGSDFVEGGITIEDAVEQARLLVGAGIDVLHVMGGTRWGGTWRGFSFLSPPAPMVSLAEAVKKALPQVPVITVGRIHDPPLADSILREGKADFVAMGRGLLADPELPNKAREGRLDDIRRCIACYWCTADAGSRDTVKYPGLCCCVNPSLSFIWRRQRYPGEPAARAKKVMVIGGGLAGMEAAKDLALRGHRVGLYERSDRLGGQWNIAEVQDYKKDAEFPRLPRQLAAALEPAGVTVHLHTEVTRQLVQKERPDVVIVATGASPLTSDIPGANLPNVVQAVDVLEGKARTGNIVAVLGGRYVGLETALHLAERGKKRVYLLTRSKLGRGLHPHIKKKLKDKLIEHGVYLFPESPVVEILPHGLRFLDDDEYRFLLVDTVVLALGYKPEDKLVGELKGVVPEVHIIADAAEPRDAFIAMHEAADIASRL